MFYSFVRGLYLQSAEVLYSMQSPVRFRDSARVCFPDGHTLEIAKSRCVFGRRRGRDRADFILVREWARR